MGFGGGGVFIPTPTGKRICQTILLFSNTIVTVRRNTHTMCQYNKYILLTFQKPPYFTCPSKRENEFESGAI